MLPSYVVFVLLGMMAASGESELVVTVAATATGSTIGALAWYGLGLALGAKRIEALIERFGRFMIPEARPLSSDGRRLQAQSLLGHRRGTDHSGGAGLSLHSGRRAQSCDLELPRGNADRKHHLERASSRARICLARAKRRRRFFGPARRHGPGRVRMSRTARLAANPSMPEDRDRIVRAQAISKVNVIVMPPTRPMRNCSVLGAAYMPSGCRSRDTSSARHQQMDPCRRQAGHFQHRHHQRDDGDVFDEVGMGADRAAQLHASVVAERGPVALAQPADLEGEDGVEQGENGEIGRGDRGQVHVCLPVLQSFLLQSFCYDFETYSARRAGDRFRNCK